jgi:hypothetical protein
MAHGKHSHDESLIEELLDSLETRDAQIKNLEEESASLKSQLQDAATRATSFRNRYEDARAKISFLEKDMSMFEHELAKAERHIRNDREKAEQRMAEKDSALEALQREHASVVERLKLLESRADSDNSDLTRQLSQPVSPRSPKRNKSPRRARFKPPNESQGNPGRPISSEYAYMLTLSQVVPDHDAVSPSNKPYEGPRRRLILGIDVGTTFSGVSYSILIPGVVPIIQGVNRCVANYLLLGLSVDEVIMTQLPSAGQSRRRCKDPDSDVL